MPCSHCIERGKTWKGDNPKCAFERANFSEDNFRCATIEQLRAYLEENHTYSADERCGVVPIANTGRFIVLQWYKWRGRTSHAFVLDSSGDLDKLTLTEAELAIKGMEGVAVTP